MSGYPQHSFDLNVEGDGRPLRPYNWVQWTGVILFVLSLGAYGYDFAQRIGWILAPRIYSSAVGLPLLMIGINLVYSRRSGSVDLAPELAAARKRWLLVTLAICAIVFGAAIIIDFKGA